ncbi:TetR/AcrR family transcriptional regulator C-terminal domain-containing protein [Nocardia mexicana]|uniref:TetR family transcriptional regulator n=1 Tax=Nocardia mexicana TaxID=279262 RepID=A0A370GY54_9NOCA|nr:TetR/AcrR family transcriptional regulator C-terminal domain-containing protein [Nocardia mexicana]RDI48419.1 TetR family transcriptional regulator [Nocardia mexicana]
MREQPLTRGAIVAAARRIADAEGLSALTLRRVAQDLNTGQASLYRHIADRRELLALLNDDLARAFPVVRDGGPRERIVRQWLGAHRVLLDHPWAAKVIIDAASVTATALPFAESGIGALLDAGLSPEVAARTYRAVWHLLLGYVVNEHPLGHPGLAVDANDYPALTTARPHLAAADAVADFEWALHRLLDAVLGTADD